METRHRDVPADGSHEHRAQYDGCWLPRARRAPRRAETIPRTRRLVDVQLDRHAGAAPDAIAIEKRLRDEARDVYGWSNGAGDRYAEHAHSYDKLLYCTRGSIDFILGDGRT